MPKYRIKVSAPLREFQEELGRLVRFDTENQRNFSASTGSSVRGSLSARQLQLLTESIFFAAFRAYQNFLRDIFLLYCLEKRPRSGKRVRSYLKPKNFGHAELLIQSQMPFLDWVSPDNVIERAELYLERGFPVRLPYTAGRETFLDMKKIRNHIAHNSKESLREYKKVLRKHYTIVPLVIPTPGQFLLETDRRHPNKYKLQVYLEFLQQISVDLT
jgi:hypothetical protein